MDQIADSNGSSKTSLHSAAIPTKLPFSASRPAAASVITMMTSPLAEGLFQRAIIESGGGRDGLGGMPMISGREPEWPPVSRNYRFELSPRQKASPVQMQPQWKPCANFPPSKWWMGLNMASMFQAMGTYSGPIIDGKLIVETPQDAFLAGHQMKIPVMIGANSRDIGFSFAKTMPEVVAPFRRKPGKGARSL